jgi:hypothetical protein
MIASAHRQGPLAAVADHSLFSALAASVAIATQYLRSVSTSPAVLNIIAALVNLSRTGVRHPSSVGAAVVQTDIIKSGTRRRDRSRLDITVRTPIEAGQALRDDPQRSVDWYLGETRGSHADPMNFGTYGKQA